MCQVKNSPIKPGKYQNDLFGNYADQCMVRVIDLLNTDPELATVASCCGHGKKTKIPYITLVQPRSRIKEVKTFLENSFGWSKMLISIFPDLPEFAYDQLGWKFLRNKVYVGYYDNAFHLADSPCNVITETWRENDLQVA